MPKSKKRAAVVRKQKDHRTREQRISTRAHLDLRNSLMRDAPPRSTSTSAPRGAASVVHETATAVAADPTPVVVEKAPVAAAPVAAAPTAAAPAAEAAEAVPTITQESAAEPLEGAKSFACPRCGSAAGEQCVSASGVAQSWSSTHAARRKLADV